VSRPSADAVRRALLEHCREGLAAVGLTPETAGDDLDLRDAGVVDSLGFVELIVELERDFGVDVDLDGMDADRLTVVGALVALVSAPAPASELSAP